MSRLLCLAVVLFLGPAAIGGSIDGRWDATIRLRGTKIPFRFDLSASGGDLRGTLFNGDVTVTSTSARREGEKIVLEFGHYLTTIRAAEKDGRLEGEVEGRFDRDKYLSSVPFEAVRYREEAPADSAGVPSIAGVWEVPHESPKGEQSWRLIVRQEGAEVSASILRIDGDTGALTGRYRDGRFILGHFSGSRPLRVEITPAKDGTLAILRSGASAAAETLVAYRPETARAIGLPEPSDPLAHTTVNDPGEPFRFRFPDVNGQTVSHEDERFQGKVVVAVVTGSWCPNCHDEAQYLVELHRKYRDKGLEIVALDFEEPEQQADLARVKSFIKKYGVEYPYLIAGAPSELWEKVPQALNLDSWPTTFFIGRDGKVKVTHAGFAAPASGAFHTKLREEFTSTIEKLLSDGATASP
jgi:thiol-disulfide isomerase/thioredoxin